MKKVSLPTHRPADTGLFDRWAPRLIVLLVGVIPLIIGLNMEDTFDLPKLIWVYLTDLILMSLWVGQALHQRRISWRRTVFDLPLLFFLGVALLSTLFSIDPWLSALGAYRIYAFGLIPITALAVLFWFTAQVSSHKLRDKVAVIAMVSAAIVSLYGVLQYTGNELFERMPAIVGGRVWSSLGNPLYLGAVCAMALPIVLSTWMTCEGLFWQGMVFAGFIGVLVGLALSLSRSAWVGAGAAVLMLGITTPELVRKSRKFILPLAALIAMVILFPNVRQRGAHLASRTEGSNAARIAGWKGGLKIWRAHPWLGSGTDTFFEAYRPYRSMAYVQATGSSVTQADAHNDFVQIASTQGALGLVAYGFLVFVFLKWLLPMRGKDPRIPFAAGLLALFVQNQFNFSSVTTSAWAAVFAGLIVEPMEGTLTLELPWRRFFSAVSWMIWAGCAVGVWAISRPVRADIAYKAGLAAAQQTQYIQAVRLYKEATELQARIEPYHMELANTWRTLGSMSADVAERTRYFDQAWATADTLVRDHPWDADVWNNRGVAAMWLVQLDHRETLRSDARQSFERAVQLDPVFADAWANLAKWEHLAGHMDQEKALWRKVLEINPMHPMALQVLSQTS